ncbi:MAG: hypothetical protein NC223_02570 [Butyrivibrio sp.]|nr:hypothetical protein [Butyrivibrio sp.]
MYFFIMAAAAFLIGLAVNTFLRKRMNELVREAEGIEHTGFGFFRQLKLRYENCLKMGHEISNTAAFAEKYLDKYKIYGVKLGSFEKVSAFASGMCVVCGICGALLDKSHTMEYLLVGFLAMYIISGTRRLIDIPGKKERITVNLVDYFENRFSAATAEPAVKQEREPSETSRTERRAKEFSAEEKKLIDEILREYLG